MDPNHHRNPRLASETSRAGDVQVQAFEFALLEVLRLTFVLGKAEERLLDGSASRLRTDGAAVDEDA